MASIIHEASCNFDLCQAPQPAAGNDVYLQNNGKLIIDTDTKWNIGHITSPGASNGALDSVTVSSTAINGGVLIDGRSVQMIPYTGGSGTAPGSLLAGPTTMSAATTTLTFTAAVTHPAGTKFYTSTGTYMGTLLSTITAATTGTLAATVVAAQATALAYYYQLPTLTIIDATWLAGVATITTSDPHGFVAGDWVSIGGLRGTDVLDGYNGTFELLSGSGTTFTYTLAVSPGAYFKTLASTTVVTSNATTAFTFTGTTTLTEGQPIYSSAGAYIGTLSAHVTATAGVGRATSLVTQTPTAAFYYGSGRCIKQPRCDQTQTYTLTSASALANIATITIPVNHGIIVGNSVVVSGTTNFNGTFTVTAVTSTTFTYTLGSTPATETAGTVTKTVKSIFLGTWSSFSAGQPVNTTTTANTTGSIISALGWAKVKNVLNGPFNNGALLISGSGAATPVATAQGPAEPGWIEVVGGEAGVFTIPRVASFEMLGSWFHPATLPFVVSSTSAATLNLVTVTTAAAHNIPASVTALSGSGFKVYLRGISTAAHNGGFRVVSVPSATTFTIAADSLVGSGAGTGGAGWARVTTTGVAQQIIQLPTYSATVSLQPYAGIWVERVSTHAVISTASWAANVVTFTTTTLGPFIDNLAVGDDFTVLGVLPAPYNGEFTCTGKSYASATTVTITATMLNNPGTFSASTGTIVSDLSTASATWANGYLTVNTTQAHNLFPGMIVENTFSNPSTYDGIFEIYDTPTSTSFRVAMTTNPGIWVSTNLCTYEFWPNTANCVATAAAYPVNYQQGRQIHMLAGSGQARIGGDGTNAWGYTPPAGLKILIPNIITSNATKTATTGVLAQVAPSATLTTRPKLLTGGVVGSVNVDKACLSWYLSSQQGFSYTMNHVALLESTYITEIASFYKFNNVGTGMSSILTAVLTGTTASVSAAALAIGLCYSTGTITNNTFSRFHVTTAGHWCVIANDATGVTWKNNRFPILRTTATMSGSARNAAAGTLLTTRCSNMTFNSNQFVGGQASLVTSSNLTFTNTDYMDTLEGPTATTIPMSVFVPSANSSAIVIDGITFGKGITVNTQPYSALLSPLSGATNIRLMRVGTTTTPLSAGSANAMGSIILGVAASGANNIRIQQVYTTLLRLGHQSTLDNSYANISWEDVWGDALAATTTNLGYVNATLNTTSKKLGTKLGNLTLGSGNANTAASTTVTFASNQTLAKDVILYGSNGQFIGQLSAAIAAAPTGTLYAASSAQQTAAAFYTATPTYQTAVYGHTFEDYLDPITYTILTGTAWNVAGYCSYTTQSGHPFVAGDQVTISNTVSSAVSPTSYNMTSGFNGTFTVLASPAPTATTFAVTMIKNPGVWASGGSINPVTGAIAIQMNEQTAVNYYTINKLDAGSGFTSTGTIAMLNVGDDVEFTTPDWILGHSRFTYGAVAPYVATRPTIITGNQYNHDVFYKIDKGAGYGANWSNVWFNAARGNATWSITAGSLTILNQVTPTSTTVTGSITSNILTVTAVTSGTLYEGCILSGTGITANTIITSIIAAPQGGVGTYGVQVITFAAGTYTVASTSANAASTTITGVTSTYGLNVGDYVYNTTLPGNFATGATIASINTANQITMSLAGTASTLQRFVSCGIHSETGIVAATGFKLKVKVKTNTYSATNLLQAIKIPTVTSSVFQQVQYPLDTITLTLTGLQTGSDIVILGAGTSTEKLNVDANAGTTYNYVYSSSSVVDIGVFKAGFVPFYIRNYTLPSTSASVPIAQFADRNYA